MRAILYNVRKMLQMIVVLILTLFITMMIGKIFIHKNNLIKDFKLLSSISSETIISLQQSKPEVWKDYLAVISTVQSIPSQELSSENNVMMRNAILAQLDRNIAFQQINWSGIDGDLKQAIQSLRQLLEKYPVYDPEQYTFPLKRTCYYIDTYGADREGGARTHQGTDLFDQKGTQILSVCSGTIEKLGWNRLGGERVGVRGNDGNYYYYAHLDTINDELYINQNINKGEFIGTVGNTGDAITTPDHLHFGIELPNGEWLNPYNLLKVWEYHKFGIANS